MYCLVYYYYKTVIWNDIVDVDHKLMIAPPGRIKIRLKTEMQVVQKAFDRKVQSAKNRW